MLSLKDFYFDVPQAQIAKYPLATREASRLMVLDQKTHTINDQKFTDIIDFFKKGDVLVFNNSKVFACRLITQRVTGGRQEILLLNQISSDLTGEAIWQVMLNASRKVHAGDEFEFLKLKIQILDETGNQRRARLQFEGDLFQILDEIAEIPLPPYMQRQAEDQDKERYQTVYAKDIGSVAAPTAGLHFTESLLAKLKNKGVILTEVTLHVGPGTFLPVKTDTIEEHVMHTEAYSISQTCCDVINLAKKEGRTVTAVGTTVTRVLEHVALNGSLTPHHGTTNIFIYPPYTFKIIDCLITNFHLPESTLLMLVSAFVGREFTLKAYHQAVNKGYRFFSYGDAMLIK